MSTIFSKIVDGSIPSYKVAEDDDFYAFLDINPLVKGHTLVIPKEEINYYFDMPDKLMADYSIFTKKVSKAIKTVIPCERIGVAVIGLEVPHAHTHLMPINQMNDMNFSNLKLNMPNEELAIISTAIAKAFTSL